MRCKPGDMAFIIRSKREECLGWLVTVEGKHPQCDPDEWLISHPGRVLRGTEQSIIPDSWLRPLPGNVPADDVRQDEEITA